MDSPWRIQLLGCLCAERDDRVIRRFRTQKTAALFAYLAYHRETSHPREVVSETFWPEDEPDTARHKLRMALSSLRGQLEPPGIPTGAVIAADRAGVQLNPVACATDVAAFQAALRSAIRCRSDAERARLHAEAVDVFAGRQGQCLGTPASKGCGLALERGPSSGRMTSAWPSGEQPLRDGASPPDGIRRRGDRRGGLDA